MGKKKSGFLKEFKEFAMKGNMLDLAVGVIVGGAFKTVVDALTNSVIMPVVSMFLGGLSFEEWKIRLPQFFGEKLDENGEVIVNYLRFGDFLSAFINFVIMAFVVFLIVKTVNRLREAGEKHRKKEAEAPAAPPEPTKEEQLLTEIRDLLKKGAEGSARYEANLHPLPAGCPPAQRLRPGRRALYGAGPHILCRPAGRRFPPPAGGHPPRRAQCGRL